MKSRLSPKTIEFFTILTDLSSTKDKEQLLRTYDTQEIRSLLNYSLDPYKHYYITKINKAIPYVDCKLSGHSGGFFSLLDKLNYKIISGHDAHGKVRDFLDNKVKCAKSKAIYQKILFREPLGIATNTVNKIYPYSIPTFNCMLADNSPIDRSIISYPDCIFTEKLDGFRCLIIQNRMYSRSGKPIRNVNLTAYFNIHNISVNEVFDGELYSPSHSLIELSSILNHTDRPLPDDLKLYVFDSMTYRQWSLSTSQQTYQTRIKLTIHKIKKINNPHIIHLDTHEVSTQSEMESLLNKIINKGGEGLMGRLKTAPYVFKRTRNSTQYLFKIKPFHTIDLPIKDFYEGQGKYKGVLGGVFVEYKGEYVSVGSGWSDQERKTIWHNRNAYINKILEVKYLHETEDKYGKKSLNLPTVVRLRPDKDI